MKSRQNDIVIIGAGCAGLSLGWHIAQVGRRGRRVVLLEPRTKYTRDRTWCFWNVAPHDFEDLVSQRWAAWRVRAPGGSWVTRTAPDRRYELLQADAFYERVLGELYDAGVEVRLGTSADTLHETPEGVTIGTSDGPVHAEMVFDSRPPSVRAVADPGHEVCLLQHFLGWEVETDRPIFEPSVATLMDFTHPAQPCDGVAFTYVLPSSPTRALVEATWFSTDVLADDEYAGHLEAWLHRRGAREWVVHHRERGVIPMQAGSFPIRPSSRVHRIGLAGGAAKPSTGYAFQAIQRQCKQLAQALWHTPVPPTVPARSSTAAAQDAVFLSYLARHPERGPQALVRLFERVDPDRLIRFLSDCTSPTESLAVMAAMPPGAMTAEVLRASQLIRQALHSGE